MEIRSFVVEMPMFGQISRSKRVGTSGRLLTVLAILLLAQPSCSKFETIETTIAGFEDESSTGIPSLVGLKLSPPTSRGRELAIKYGLCLDPNKDCAGPPIFLGEANKSSLLDHRIDLVAGGNPLAAKDLRIGHRIVTEYTNYHNLQLPPVKVENYIAPSKYLRVTLSVLIGEGKPYSNARKEIESIIITHLSWRLPADLGLVRNSETTEGLNVIGDLDVKYSLIESKTIWQMRKTQIDEFLHIKTRLADSGVSSNWAELRLSGGSRPLGNEAGRYSYESSFMKLTMFEIRAVE